jgi:hypothetical protein
LDIEENGDMKTTTLIPGVLIILFSFALSAFVGQREVPLPVQAAILSAAESRTNVPAVPAKNNLPTDITAYRESAHHGDGFSASATAIEFYFNDGDPPIYPYTGEAQDITATVELSIATQGEYDPQDPLPTWTVTITREIDQVEVNSVDFTYLDEPYSDPNVSIELPADAGEYEYTASLTAGDGIPDPVTKTAYVTSIGISLSKTRIAAGHINDEYHMSIITVTVTPAVANASITLELVDNSTAETPASLSATSLTTNENGEATAELTSSNTGTSVNATVNISAYATNGDQTDKVTTSCTFLMPTNEFYNE